MRNRTISIDQAILIGKIFVNGGVILVIFGIWILSFVLVVKFHLSVWYIFIGLFAGPIIAWPWWSFAKPIWEHWAVRHIDELYIEEFYDAAIQAQLAWPRGHIFEKTEFRSTKKKNGSKQHFS